MVCRAGGYGDYQQSAMYMPVSGLYYHDVQVCTISICHTDFIQI